MMLLALAVASLATGGLALAHLLHGRSERQRFRGDRARFEVTRADEESRRERLQLLGDLPQQFPHLARELEAALAGEGAPDGALARVLRSAPGVPIGRTTGDLPVVLPHAVRTRHLCCFGRTGTGKTSLALRLIQDDLVSGRGVVVLGAERELFRDHLLPILPERRWPELIYFAPADADCPVAWNPFEAQTSERHRAAVELFAVFRRTFGEDSIGPQSDPIARNAFLALAGLPGATFLTLRAFLERGDIRERLLPQIDDPLCRAFWEKSYPALSRNASRPFLNRIEAFTGTPGIRRALCRPEGNLSLGEAIDGGKLLFVDLSGFDPDTTRLVGQLVLAFLQIALMRRERMPESERRLSVLYADEFHEISAHSADTFRQLLSKGRRYGLALNLLSQFPGQLDTNVRQEIFGNCATVISLAISAQDAGAIGRELLLPTEDGPPEPVPGADLVSLPVGCAYARIGTGALALPLRLDPPLPTVDRARGELARSASWSHFVPSETHDALDLAPEARPVSPRTPALPPLPLGPLPTPAPPRLSRDERRFLDAVIASPGRNSSEYAKLARMSGATALACRRSLVASGFLRAHRVATGPRGRLAIILEPLSKADPPPSDTPEAP